MTLECVTGDRIEPCPCGADKKGCVHGFVWVDGRAWAMYLAALAHTDRRPRIDLALGLYSGGTIGLSITRDGDTLHVDLWDEAARPLGSPMEEESARSIMPGLVDTVRRIVTVDRRLRMHLLDPSLSLVVLEVEYAERRA
jgi:hypothetical protein